MAVSYSISTANRTSIQSSDSIDFATAHLLVLSTLSKEFPMAYRNKTFVSFTSEDHKSYWLMMAWKANKKIDFNFYDAHDLNTALDTSHPDTIKRRLREQLPSAKQIILLTTIGVENFNSKTLS
jgi:hypothetical protein